MVGVHHNGQAGEQEQQRDHPRVALVALGLKPQPQQSQQQRQGIVVVAALLLRHRIWQIRLRPEAHLVDEVDARHPVAVDQLVAVLVVVLAPGKIPHEVAEPHLAHLVVHEVLEVFGKRDFFVGISAKNPLVVLYVVGLVRPHAWKKSNFVFGVVRLGRLAVVDDLVLARGLAVEVGGRSVGVGLAAVELAVEALSVEHRPVSVLLAVVVGQERHRVLGVVLVNRRVGVRADGQYDKARVADQQHHDGQDSLLDKGAVGLDGPADSEVHARNQCEHHQHRTRVFGQANAVDGGDFKESEQAQNDRNNHGKNKGQHKHRYGVGHHPRLPGHLGVVLVEVDHDDRWNGQEDQDVNPHRESGQVGHQQQPAVGAHVVVRRGLPLERCPKGHSRKEARHGVHLTLYGAVPE